MAERLCFDPTREDPSNAPLEIISPTDDEIIGLISHDYPAPALTVQWAGSVDTSGALPASRKYENRTIPLSIEVADPGLAAASNKATNPKAAADTTGWTNNSLTLMERQTNLPARLDPFDTAIHATGNADDDAAYLSASVTNAVSEIFTAWVYVVSGTVRLEVWNATPTLNASSSNITTGSWQKIALPYTPTTTATYTFRVAQNGAGTSEFYVTGMQIGPAYPYFDGDTPGCSWSGTRNASSSTRPAGEARFNAAVADVQAKIAKLAREGGTLRRVLNDGTPITFDLHTGDTFSVTFDVAYQAGLAAISVGLTALPEGRGDSVTLSDHTETTAPALTFTETGIKGDLPGLGSLIIDNDQASTSQETLIWSIQSRYTNTGIPLLVEAENATYVTGIGATAAAGPAGASGSGSNVLKTSTLGTSEQQLCVARFAAVGTFNVFARVQAPVANAGLVSMRMLWGNIGSPVPSDADGWIELDDLSAGQWILVKLGQITARQQLLASTGNWYFLLGGKTTSGSTDVLNLDYFLVVPVDEGYGEMYDPFSPVGSGAPNGGVVLNDHEIQRYGGGSIGLGSDFDRPFQYEGDYLRVPPSGAEGRTLRMIVKLSRGQILTAPGGQGVLGGADSGVDDLSARLTYTPRYLVVPSA